MLPVSPQFLATVRGSHGIVSNAKILTPPGVFGTNLVGTQLQIVDGTVTLDNTADVRGTCDITVKAAWPTSVSNTTLTPYGTEIAVSRGVQYANGNTESAPLGIFRLTAVEQQDAPRGTIRLTGSDRMSAVKEALLLNIVSFTPGMTVGFILQTLIQGGTVNGQTVAGPLPAANIIWDDPFGTTTGQLTQITTTQIAEGDRFAFLDGIIKPLGKIWYFDYRGILIVKTPPIGSYTNTSGNIVQLTNTSPPVWSANAGPNGVLVSAHRTLTREGVYNAVFLTGESLTALSPPTSTVVDADPSSLTYFYGTFGQVPLVTTLPGIYSQAQCDAAAASLLLQGKGLPLLVDFTQVPNPALEPYDYVQLVYPIDLTATPKQKIENHYLQQVVIGLGQKTGMACSTRLTTSNGKLK